MILRKVEYPLLKILISHSKFAGIQSSDGDPGEVVENGIEP
jgi:hypothetical protein